MAISKFCRIYLEEKGREEGGLVAPLPMEGNQPFPLPFSPNTPSKIKN